MKKLVPIYLLTYTSDGGLVVVVYGDGDIRSPQKPFVSGDKQAAEDFKAKMQERFPHGRYSVAECEAEVDAVIEQMVVEEVYPGGTDTTPVCAVPDSPTDNA